MKKGGIERRPFAELEHVGVIVKDMDKVIDYLSFLGIGPFEVPKEVELTETMDRGKLSHSDLKMRIGQMGTIKLELLQPLEGESVQREFLDSKGEGIHHLAFVVDNIDEELPKLINKGLKVIQSGRGPTGYVFVYLEAEELGGMVIELSKRPPE